MLLLTADGKMWGCKGCCPTSLEAPKKQRRPLVASGCYYNNTCPRRRLRLLKDATGTLCRRGRQNTGSEVSLKPRAGRRSQPGVRRTWAAPSGVSPQNFQSSRPPGRASARRSLLLLLLLSGRVVGPTRLDDLLPQGAGLVVLVAVVGGGVDAAALVVADVDDHAGGGGGGGLELVLVSWNHTETDVVMQGHEVMTGGVRGRSQGEESGPTWSQLGDGTQQVVVDHRHGVLRLGPAHRGGGGGRDQELLSVLWRRSLASAAARASLKLILTRRNDLKYWNRTSGSKDRNRDSKLAWNRGGEPNTVSCSLTCASGRPNTSWWVTAATRQKRLHLVVLMCMMDPGSRSRLHPAQRGDGEEEEDEEEEGGERWSVAFPRVMRRK
ncbi:hypothetical protein EYF80_055729 [Liparis tanakae]|uniref:Uncharacterized protein n=1 Tax=Liparis tanakae TaxID=230148 RepID=A0A4Z2F019_9TELE|nr:hypothetical protein EYF80_055729 [Liparis tanakae]